MRLWFGIFTSLAGVAELALQSDRRAGARAPDAQIAAAALARDAEKRSERDEHSERTVLSVLDQERAFVDAIVKHARPVVARLRGGYEPGAAISGCPSRSLSSSLGPRHPRRWNGT